MQFLKKIPLVMDISSYLGAHLAVQLLRDLTGRPFSMIILKNYLESNLVPR